MTLRVETPQAGFTPVEDGSARKVTVMAGYGQSMPTSGEYSGLSGPAVWRANDDVIQRFAADAEPADIRETLEEGGGVVRMALGEPGTDAEARFCALVDRIGTRVSQTTQGDRLFRVEDAALAAGDPRGRGPNSRKALSFHSDRCDVIAFMCVRPAARGGENMLVSAAAVHNEVLRRRPDLIDVLYRPFWWQRHTIDGANAHAYYAMPVFARTGGRFACTLMQVLIERAHASGEVPPLSDAQREALALVQEIAAQPDMQLRFTQAPGEVLLLNNYAVLHARTAFEDNAQGPRRLLLRAWLSVPNSRPLPDSWRAHYGETAAGALRGGIRSTRVHLKIPEAV